MRGTLIRRVRAWARPALLRELMPDRLIFGPVFGAQMRVSGRHRATYLLRFLYAGALMLVTAVSMVETWGQDTAGWRGWEYQRIAPDLLRTIGVVQLIAMLLVGPVSVGPSLGDEKRSGTLGALLTTPMPAIQIVCSRLGVQLVNMLILVLMSAPLLLAVRAFGGVPAVAIVGTSLLAISTGLLGASLSAWFSLSRAGSTGATVSAVAAQLGVWALCLVSAAISTARSGPAWPPPQVISVMATPAGLIDIYSSMSGAGRSPLWTGVWVLNVAFNLAATAGIALLAARSLRGAMNASPDDLKARTARSMPALAGLRQRGQRPSRSVGDDPVWWREMGRRPGVLLGRWSFGLLGLTMLVVLAEVQSPRDAMYPLFTAFLAFLGLAIGVSTPMDSIAGERSSRSLDVLMTTPLTARGIVRAKLAGVLRRMIFFPLLLMLLVVMGMAFGDLTASALVTVPLVVMPPLVLQACAGLWISASSASAGKAARLSLLVWLVLWLGIPVLVALVLSTLASLGLGPARWLSGVLGAAHPMSAALGVVVSELESSRQNPTSYVFGPKSGGNSLDGFLLVAGAVAAAYLGAAWICLQRAVARLRALSGRRA